MLDVLVSILGFFPVVGLAALGGYIGQKAGVWNMAIEGMMTFGAFAGVFAYMYLGESLWVSLFFGLLVGVVMGSLLSLLCVYYGLDQIVVGFGLWFVMEGLAGFLYGTLASGVKVTERPPLFLGLDPVLYLSLALFPLAYYLINRTGPGITVVSVGENPRVADTAGVDITRVRWICTALGSGLISLAGAYLSLVILQGFTDRLVAGYGWAAFALVLFSRWSVSWLLGGSLFFTVLVGLQIRLQVAGFQLLPYEFMVIIPHMGVIVALVLVGMMGKRMGMPSGLGRHYRRE